VEAFEKTPSYVDGDARSRLVRIRYFYARWVELELGIQWFLHIEVSFGMQDLLKDDAEFYETNKIAYHMIVALAAF